MTYLKKSINLQYIYLTLKAKYKYQNIQTQPPISAVYIDILQFIQKSVFDYNICTENWVSLIDNFDNH